MKVISATVALGIVASLFAVSPALAAEEVRVDVQSGRGAYFTVTNVVERVEAFPVLLKAEAPVTVSFHGDTPLWVNVDEYDSIVVSGGFVMFGNHVRPVQFEGDSFTLTTPGYYHVMAAPEAAMATEVAIELVAPGAGEPATEPAEEPAAEPAEQPAEEPATEPAEQPAEQPVAEPAEEPAPEAQSEAVAAVPTPSTVLVNGEAVAFEAYNIDGYNYFKLRDLAAALSGSAKQFEVTWDEEKNAINLVSGTAYTPVGGELTASGEAAAQQATPTTAKVYVNGAEVEVTAYNIGGYNYFKLRDIAKAIDFGVTWDAETSTIGIDPASSYTE
nr:stalk domain-containing protein [Symbiobacterium terraclitae]